MKLDIVRENALVMWVDREVAADHFGVTGRTIDRWMKEEGLPVHRLGRGPKARKRYDLAELDTWARNRCSDRHPSNGRPS